ncbi:unnamed protein product [Cunninghamella blakesleeana]
MKSIFFVKGESETSQYNSNNDNKDNKDNEKRDNSLGVEIAQLYDSILKIPSTSTTVQTNPTSMSFIKEEDTEQSKEAIYCPSCDMKVKDPSHFHGIAHLVSSEKDTDPSQPSPTNTNTTKSSTTITRLEMEHGQDLALKLMKKNGWDYGQGLGKHNQGEKYPLQATWKQDRLGLGHPNTIKKKITNKSILQPPTTIQQQKIKGKQLAANAKAESTLRSAMLHYMNN